MTICHTLKKHPHVALDLGLIIDEELDTFFEN